MKLCKHLLPRRFQPGGPCLRPAGQGIPAAGRQAEGSPQQPRAPPQSHPASPGAPRDPTSRPRNHHGIGTQVQDGVHHAPGFSLRVQRDHEGPRLMGAWTAEHFRAAGIAKEQMTPLVGMAVDELTI